MGKKKAEVVWGGGFKKKKTQLYPQQNIQSTRQPLVITASKKKNVGFIQDYLQAC